MPNGLRMFQSIPCENCSNTLLCRSHPEIWICLNCEAEARGKLILGKILDKRVPQPDAAQRVLRGFAPDVALGEAMPLLELTSYLAYDPIQRARLLHLKFSLLARNSIFRRFSVDASWGVLPSHWGEFLVCHILGFLSTTRPLSRKPRIWSVKVGQYVEPKEEDQKNEE